ncbi:MAG: hypothetical protein LBK06_10690 [Planctomycetaceae bacterium]|jgi:hypothetical protein|nr:hypothetical protein [Planctomycetaceae bacterium]
MSKALNFSRSTYESYAEFVKTKSANIGKYFYDSKFIMSNSLALLEISPCFEIACLKHAEIPADKILDDVTPFLQKCATISIDYFWQLDNKSGKYIRQSVEWAFVYPMSLMCSLWLAEETSIFRIAEWSNETIEYQPDADMSKMDTLFFIILSRFICSGTLSNNKHLIEIIRSNKARRPKLLVDVLEAIEQKDTLLFQNTLEKYIKHYIKNEVDSNSIEGSISLYASLVWETARYEGLVLPSFPEDIMDRIVTRESIGCDK